MAGHRAKWIEVLINSGEVLSIWLMGMVFLTALAKSSVTSLYWILSESRITSCMSLAVSPPPADNSLNH